MLIKAPITFEQFKATLIDKFGEKNIHFREQGQHGWSRIEISNSEQLTMSHGNPGPHWCDASPIPATQKLLGTYNFNSKTGKFF